MHLGLILIFSRVLLAAGACVDSTLGDGQDFSDGFNNCTWFSQDYRCYYHGRSYSNQNLTADRACCVCGGGVDTFPAAAQYIEIDGLCQGGGEMGEVITVAGISNIDECREGCTGTGGCYGLNWNSKDRFCEHLFSTVLTIAPQADTNCFKRIFGDPDGPEESGMFPFGPTIGDTVVEKGDDTFSEVINLTQPFAFYGKSYTQMYVNVNGVLSFNGTQTSYVPESFPASTLPAIAPFWADIDTRQGVAEGGKYNNNIWYQQYNATSPWGPSVLSRANAIVRRRKASLANFNANWAFVASWYGVDRWYGLEPGRKRWSQKNTFQAVLISDGSKAITLFSYPCEGLNWHTGKLRTGQVPAQVGFDAGDGINFYNRNESQTPEVLGLACSHTEDALFFEVDGVQIQEQIFTRAPTPATAGPTLTKILTKSPTSAPPTGTPTASPTCSVGSGMMQLNGWQGAHSLEWGQASNAKVLIPYNAADTEGWLVGMSLQLARAPDTNVVLVGIWDAINQNSLAESQFVFLDISIIGQVQQLRFPRPMRITPSQLFGLYQPNGRLQLGLSQTCNSTGRGFYSSSDACSNTTEFSRNNEWCAALWAHHEECRSEPPLSVCDANALVERGGAIGDKCESVRPNANELLVPFATQSVDGYAVAVTLRIMEIHKQSISAVIWNATSARIKQRLDFTVSVGWHTVKLAPILIFAGEWFGLLSDDGPLGISTSTAVACSHGGYWYSEQCATVDCSPVYDFKPSDGCARLWAHFVPAHCNLEDVLTWTQAPTSGPTTSGPTTASPSATPVSASPTFTGQTYSPTSMPSLSPTMMSASPMAAPVSATPATKTPTRTLLRPTRSPAVPTPVPSAVPTMGFSLDKAGNKRALPAGVFTFSPTAPGPRPLMSSLCVPLESLHGISLVSDADDKFLVVSQGAIVDARGVLLATISSTYPLDRLVPAWRGMVPGNNSFVSVFPNTITLLFSEAVLVNTDLMGFLAITDGARTLFLENALVTGSGTNELEVDVGRFKGVSSSESEGVKFTVVIMEGKIRDKANRQVGAGTMSFVLDTIKPKLVGSVPKTEIGFWLTEAPSSLLLMFDEIVTAAEVECAFLLTSDTNQNCIKASDISGSGTSDLKIQTNFSAMNAISFTSATGTIWSLVIRDGVIADRAGNFMLGFTLFISIDWTSPRLLTSYPVQGNKLGPWPDNFSFELSEPVAFALSAQDVIKGFTVSDGTRVTQISRSAIAGIGTSTWAVRLNHSDFNLFDKNARAVVTIAAESNVIVDRAGKQCVFEVSFSVHSDFDPPYFVDCSLSGQGLNRFVTNWTDTVKLNYSEPIQLNSRTLSNLTIRFADYTLLLPVADVFDNSIILDLSEAKRAFTAETYVKDFQLTVAAGAITDLAGLPAAETSIRVTWVGQKSEALTSTATPFADIDGGGFPSVAPKSDAALFPALASILVFLVITLLVWMCRKRCRRRRNKVGATPIKLNIGRASISRGSAWLQTATIQDINSAEAEFKSMEDFIEAIDLSHVKRPWRPADLDYGLSWFVAAVHGKGGADQDAIVAERSNQTLPSLSTKEGLAQLAEEEILLDADTERWAWAAPFLEKNGHLSAEEELEWQRLWRGAEGYQTTAEDQNRMAETLNQQLQARNARWLALTQEQGGKSKSVASKEMRLLDTDETRWAWAGQLLERLEETGQLSPDEEHELYQFWQEVGGNVPTAKARFSKEQKHMANILNQQLQARQTRRLALKETGKEDDLESKVNSQCELEMLRAESESGLDELQKDMVKRLALMDLSETDERLAAALIADNMAREQSLRNRFQCERVKQEDLVKLNLAAKTLRKLELQNLTQVPEAPAQHERIQRDLEEVSVECTILLSMKMVLDKLREDVSLDSIEEGLLEEQMWKLSGLRQQAADEKLRQLERMRAEVNYRKVRWGELLMERKMPDLTEAERATIKAERKTIKQVQDLQARQRKMIQKLDSSKALSSTEESIWDSFGRQYHLRNARFDDKDWCYERIVRARVQSKLDSNGMYDSDEEKRLSTLERGHALTSGEEGRLMLTLALQVGRVEGRYEQERSRHELGLKALVIELSVTRDALHKQQLSVSAELAVGEVEQAVMKSLGECLRAKAARIERNIGSHKQALLEATDRLRELAAVDVEVAEEIRAENNLAKTLKNSRFEEQCMQQKADVAAQLEEQKEKKALLREQRRLLEASLQAGGSALRVAPRGIKNAYALENELQTSRALIVRLQGRITELEAKTSSWVSAPDTSAGGKNVEYATNLKPFSQRETKYAPAFL